MGLKDEETDFKATMAAAILKLRDFQFTFRFRGGATLPFLLFYFNG